MTRQISGISRIWEYDFIVINFKGAAVHAINNYWSHREWSRYTNIGLTSNGKKKAWEWITLDIRHLVCAWRRAADLHWNKQTGQSVVQSGVSSDYYTSIHRKATTKQRSSVGDQTNTSTEDDFHGWGWSIWNFYRTNHGSKVEKQFY